MRRTLIELLAQELRQEPESIEADRGFVELGLDSISGVTWVRAINRTYGTEVEATRVYTYPTVEQFARHVRDLLAQREAAQAVSLPEDVAAPVATAPVEARATTLFLGRDWPALQSWRDDDAGVHAQLVAPAKGTASTLHAAEIAVIGMAGRFPMAKDLDAFWDNIANGRNCVSEIPASRWDANALFVEGQPGLGQSNSKWMGVLEGHDRFDPLFFGIAPREAMAILRRVEEGVDMIAGSCIIGRNVKIGGAAGIAGHITIADGVVVSAGTSVMSSIHTPGVYTGMFPMMAHRDWQHAAAEIRQLRGLGRKVRALLRTPGAPRTVADEEDA